MFATFDADDFHCGIFVRNFQLVGRQRLAVRIQKNVEHGKFRGTRLQKSARKKEDDEKRFHEPLLSRSTTRARISSESRASTLPSPFKSQRRDFASPLRTRSASTSASSTSTAPSRFTSAASGRPSEAK